MQCFLSTISNQVKLYIGQLQWLYINLYINYNINHIDSDQIQPHHTTMAPWNPLVKHVSATFDPLPPPNLGTMRHRFTVCMHVLIVRTVRLTWLFLQRAMQCQSSKILGLFTCGSINIDQKHSNTFCIASQHLDTIWVLPYYSHAKTCKNHHKRKTTKQPLLVSSMASADWFQSLSHFLSRCGTERWLLGESKWTCAVQLETSSYAHERFDIHRKHLTERIKRKWTHLKATAKAWWELKMTESEPGEKKWKRMECKKQPGNPKQDQRIQAPHSVFLSSRDVRAWFVTELLAPHETKGAWLRTNCSVEIETLKGVWAFGRCNAKVTRIFLFGARELGLSIIHCGNPWRAVPGSSRGGTRIRKASCSVLEKRPEGREGKWMQNSLRSRTVCKSWQP